MGIEPWFLKLGFHPVGRLSSDFKKLICVEFGYPKGLMLKRQDGGAVKGQSMKLGAVVRAGGKSPPTPGHLGGGQAPPVHMEWTTILHPTEV